MQQSLNEPLRAFAAGLLLLALASSAIAEDELFNPSDTIRAAVKLIERDHVAKKPLDNELSRKWLRAFLDRLDPQRMYFLEAEFREFIRYDERLDEMAKEGDVRFPTLVRELYRTRVAEAVSYAAEFLAAEHDFSADEECPIRFEDYARKPELLRERWRLRIKAELLIEKLHGKELPDVKTQLSGRYKRISRQARDLTDERLCQIYLDALAACCDPHSGSFSPTYLTSFHQTVTFRTHRLELGLRQRDGQFVITSAPPSRFASFKQDKVVGWALIAIRRLNGATFDLVEMHPEDLAQIIRGPLSSLGSDTEIILELLNPVSFERQTISWNRIPSF
jgi:carboxyl-terminal processing protease